MGRRERRAVKRLLDEVELERRLTIFEACEHELMVEVTTIGESRRRYWCDSCKVEFLGDEI